MTIFNAIIIMQAILGGGSLLKYLHIKRLKETQIFYHEKKSFLDAFKLDTICIVIYIIAYYWITNIGGFRNMIDTGFYSEG